MTSNKINIVLYTVLLLILLVPITGHSQRKKKTQDEPQASSIKQREAEFYFTEGEKFFILEDYAKALLYYQRALEITPENATVHYKIAEVLARSNRQEDLFKASLSIENALKLERQNKYFYLLAANIYNSITKFDKAAETYEALIREVKGTEEYLYELAAVYQYAGKPDEAIKAYNRAESALGINDISSIQKQRLYLEQGKTKEAIAEGEKLINAFPDEERYIMGFAEVLSQNGFRTEAIRYLDTVRVVSRRRERGLLRRKIGDEDPAVVFAERCVEQEIAERTAIRLHVARRRDAVSAQRINER